MLPTRWFLRSAVTSALVAFSSLADAQAPATSPPPPPAETAPSTWPKLGGHLGLALPIATIAKTSTAIGADFVTIGFTPGITVKLDEKWSIDFEFVVLNEVKNTPAATTLVVDPGVVYNFGPCSAGLRVAAQVGAATNIGFVPIFVLPFRISKAFVYFVEADMPFFLRDDGSKIQPSLSFLFQTGIGF
jgi:hypothetical protein